MAWIPWVALVFAVAAAAIVMLNLHGARRWASRTRALVSRLEAARRVPATTSFDPAGLDALPDPVRRFFRAALTPGQPIVAAASVIHAGRFNLAEAGEKWAAFTSVQRVVASRPGFVWDARIAVLPGLPVRVHDAYVAGEGILHAALWGIGTLADLRGTPEVARGELMRWLAEAAWYPTALLPGQGVRWEPVDDRSARATVADGAIALTLLFRFRDDGLVESVRSEDRGRTVGGRVVPTAWEGRWSDYREQDGMRVPFTGEVAWLLPEGRHPYWRGTIAALSYEFAH
ncbi:MAG: hypothetical protein NDI88_03765 [Lysobacter sp.]|nr:hypothetical protein [Lysobacter sp.]